MQQDELSGSSALVGRNSLTARPPSSIRGRVVSAPHTMPQLFHTEFRPVRH